MNLNYHGITELRGVSARIDQPALDIVRIASPMNVFGFAPGHAGVLVAVGLKQPLHIRQSELAVELRIDFGPGDVRE